MLPVAILSATRGAFSFSVAGDAGPQPKEVKYGRNKVYRSRAREALRATRSPVRSGARQVARDAHLQRWPSVVILPFADPRAYTDRLNELFTPSGWTREYTISTGSLPKPDLFAHREALRLPASKIVEKLIEIVGRKLTAYMGGVKDVRAVDRWIAGGEIYGNAESRLRFALQVALTLSEHDSPGVVQAWLTGVNPELGDRVPLRLMRESEIDEVAPAILSAARAFLAGG